MRIATIGGGISGLAAAWHLQQQSSAALSLWESQQHLGGCIRTERVGDWLMELGPDNFATMIPDAMDWCQQMGLGAEFIRPNVAHRLARVVHRGKLQPIPQGFSLLQPTRLDAIAASRLLTLAGKWRLVREWWVPRRTDGQEESLEQFAVRRLGREVFERLVEPIVAGIFTADSKQLSMQAALPQFVEMERRHGGLLRAAWAARRERRGKGGPDSSSSRRAHGARYDQFVAPREGMGWWVDQITRQLDQTSIHRQTPITRLIHDEEGWNLLGPEGQLLAIVDRVIVACGAPAASRLLQAQDPQLAQELAAIPYASSAVGLFVVRRSEIATNDLCFGIVVPAAEKRPVLAISMTSEKYPGRVPEDCCLLRVFMGGALRADLLVHDDARLLEMAWREVQQLLRLKSPPLHRQMVRWHQAMPQYCLGHLARLQRIEERRMQLPGLYLTGNAFEGVGIPQCVRHAKRVVAQLITALPDRLKKSR
jgi:oxygen-dependent protoporphyrinogen oxidase